MVSKNLPTMTHPTFDILRGKTLAITGAGGFIGLRLIERAQALGLTLRGLELSAKNADIARAAGAEVIVGDVCNADDVRALCDGADHVCHTAAIVDADGDRAAFDRGMAEIEAWLSDGSR